MNLGLNNTQSARELATVIWGQELAFALKQCSGYMEDVGDANDTSSVDQKKILAFGARLKNELHSLWTESAADVFEIGYALLQLFAPRLQ